jgi:hypothetical protein
MITITPATGALYITADGVEHVKPMSSHEMMILIERLAIACRATLMEERDPPAGWDRAAWDDGNWSDEATLVLK